jgi:hypothetical protein
MRWTPAIRRAARDQERDPGQDMIVPEPRSGTTPIPDPTWSISGRGVLDLGRTTLTLVEELEPGVDVRAAAHWGGHLDGTLALDDGGVDWTPSSHSREFGFDPIHVAPEDVLDIHVVQYGSGGEVEIDLTDRRRIALRVDDVGPWRRGLDQAVGG